MAAAAGPSATPLSAREARHAVRQAAVTAAREAVGADVPNYDISGQQHYRIPYKDKSRFASVEAHPEWSRAPQHRTRTELIDARRAAKQPDITFDIDGDGAVGPTDYFVSKQFAKAHPNRLNTGERDELVKSLESGWMDKYAFGYEQSGAKRAHPTRQLRGKIISVDNPNDLAEVYPPHWNADTVPRYSCKKEMEMSRKAEQKNYSNALWDSWEAANPRTVPEPDLVQENYVAKPAMSNIRERREAFQRSAREAVGMHPGSTNINPYKEDMEVGLTYVEAPPITTRSELRETRKKQMRQDIAQTRLQAEQDYIPADARHTITEFHEYEMRRPDPQAMTMNKLKLKRKQDYIEYNMANFTLQGGPPEVPAYSEQAEPWWTLRESYVPEPPPCLLKEMRDSKEAQISGKVTATEVPAPRRPPASGSVACGPPPMPWSDEVPIIFDEIGHKTIKRWSEENVPPCLAAEEPRLFDGVKQAPSFSHDQAGIEQNSSFEVIRKNAIAAEVARQQRIAREDEARARAWRMYTTRGPSPDPGPTSGRSSRIAPAATGALPFESSRASSHAVLPPGEGGLAAVSRGLARNPNRALQLPITVEAGPSEDPSMPERLDRIRATAAPSATGPAGATTPGAGPSSPTPVTPMPAAPEVGGAVAVRQSGFQWLDRQGVGPKSATEESVGMSGSMPQSLRPTPRASKQNVRDKPRNSVSSSSGVAPPAPQL
mmetsp:Transcript_52435/g.112122  ORF Transcript_52435/g.112122 Transcript_52435/m.112122 type:complete len:716 (+) Transcript_52435:106-2253(+)